MACNHERGFARNADRLPPICDVRIYGNPRVFANKDMGELNRLGGASNLSLARGESALAWACG